MKSSFSTAWKSSRQPRKQRKYRHNAPLHKKHKFLSAHLSKDLRKKYGKRSLPLRAGDEVLVMRGAFGKKKAKIASVNHESEKVTLEGMHRTKRDGSKANAVFNPRILQIVSLKEDKERMSALARRYSNPILQVQDDKKAKGEKNAQK